MRDERFGPIVTAFVSPEGDYEQTLDLVDRSAPYGLTGAVFARDRTAIELAGERRQSSRRSWPAVWRKQPLPAAQAH